jgi:hypothetical protein
MEGRFPHDVGQGHHVRLVIHRDDWQVTKYRTIASLLVVSVVAVGCAKPGSLAAPRQSLNTPIPVVYAVKFPGGQVGRAMIRYRLPDATMKLENVPLPWESDVLYFRYGDQIMIEAVATNVKPLVPLQCEAISDPENPKGTSFGSSRAGLCRAKGHAGFHPQSLPA